jgi:hypothetical protein
MPQGLQLTSAGEVKGTPLVSGTFTLNIRMSDTAGTPAATAKLTLTISGQSSPPVITTSSLPNGTVVKPYPVTQLQASGGQLPYSWRITTGALPPGLRLSTTGSLSGTPATTGSLKSKGYAFQIQVTDAAGQHATANLSITIQPASLNGPSGVAKAK